MMTDERVMLKAAQVRQVVAAAVVASGEGVDVTVELFGLDPDTYGALRGAEGAYGNSKLLVDEPACRVVAWLRDDDADKTPLPR